MLDRQCGEPSVGDARTCRVGVAAEALEDRPVPLTRFDDAAVGLAEHVLAEAEGVIERARVKLKLTRVVMRTTALRTCSETANGPSARIN